MNWWLFGKHSVNWY